jgi:hypothetical protein
MIAQHPANQPSRLANDLARDGHEDVHEGLEFQAQEPQLVRTVFVSPTPRLRQAQRRPTLQAPGQAGHHHVSPVALQVVHRGRQRMQAVFQLLQEGARAGSAQPLRAAPPTDPDLPD